MRQLNISGCYYVVASVVIILSLLLLGGWANAANEVYLSSDADQSEATYVLNLETTANGAVRKFRITLPQGTNASAARLGRFIVGTTDLSNVGKLTMDPSDNNTLIADLTTQLNIRNVTSRIELFDLRNPVAGDYTVDVRTINNQNAVVEIIQPIPFSVAEVGPGDITAVTAGAGLTGGGISGDVTLAVNTSQIQSRVVGTCPTGSSIRQIDGTGNVVCQTDTNSGGTVTTVNTGTGLTGGPITTTGTISIATGAVTSAQIADGSVGAVDVDSGQIQLRVTGTCPTGSSIRQIDVTGNVACQADTNSGGTVTTVNTGTGLTGGPITSTGTISIAAGGVTSAHIADGSVGAADVDSSQVQLRVNGNCANGTAIRTINSDGTVTCEATGGGAGGVRYVDNGDGTITDNQTGLMWEKKTAPPVSSACGFTNDVHCRDNGYSWSTFGTGPNGTVFTNFLATVNQELSESSDGLGINVAGYHDWRLPNILELRSLLMDIPGCGNNQPAGPCIDPIFQPLSSGGINHYLSSTSSPVGHAWCVNFLFPEVTVCSKTGNGYGVMAVRGSRK